MIEEQRRGRQGMGGNFRFVSLFGCMDGRTIVPTREFVLDRLHLPVEVEMVFDKILEPGLVALLAHPEDGRVLQPYRQRADISVNKHGAQLAIVLGHNDCAANPVPDDWHRHQVVQAVQTVVEWDCYPQVIGIFVNAERNVEVATEYLNGIYVDQMDTLPAA